MMEKKGREVGCLELLFKFLLIFTLFIMILSSSIWGYVSYKRMEKLRNSGVLITGIITGSQGNRNTAARYYAFILDDEIIRGAFSLTGKHTNLFVGSKITIKYLPNNPKTSKPMYLLYRYNKEIREKYKYEFVKEIGKEN